MKFGNIGKYLLGVLSLAFIIGCTDRRGSSSHDNGHAQPSGNPEVTVTAVKKRAVPIYASYYVGGTKSVETVEVRARVKGILTAQISYANAIT